MPHTLQIQSMSVAEKLALMEELWGSLAQTPDIVPSPGWHEEVLATRTASIKNGSARFHTLDEVKQRLDRLSD